MKRILVIGPMGAGKSTFSQSLGKVLNIPVYHMDNMYWNKDKTYSREKLINSLHKILETTTWIIDGDYLSTLKYRIQYCDTVFVLDYPIKTCLIGIKARNGIKRVDLPWVESSSDLLDSEKYLINTFTENNIERFKILNEYHHKNSIIFKNRIESIKYLEELKSKEMFHVKQYVDAVLFDFNGTLYEDADINYKTWKQTVNSIDQNLDFEELYKYYKSTKDSEFITKIFEILNKPIVEEEIEYWVNYKEDRYRQMCVDTGRNKLRPGAEKLLNYCVGNNIPINLCTSSIKENVDFYFKNVNLGKWFDRNKVVYDDGQYLDKINMYKDCAKILNADIKNCLVFEDSMKSLKEAILSGCLNVVRVTTEETEKLPEIKQIIKDFNEFNYEILTK